MKTGKAIFLMLCAGSLWAADFQVSASLDRNQIALNEQAVLRLTISGNGGNFPQPQLPGLADFQIYNAGSSQNYTWVNGQASASISYNYVLTPLKEGKFTIPPIRFQLQNQTSETQALTLEVVKGDASSVTQGSARQEGAERPAQGTHGPAAVFITGTVDKTSVYVGEPVIFTFRLYNRVQLLSRPSYQPPEMTGFWTEDLPPQRTFTEAVKGIPYNVTEVRTALFPSTPGKAHVGSASLTVNLENFGTDPMGSDFFAQFFGRGEQKVLRTEAVSVTVKPLPSPKPADFKGAVGQYNLAAQVDKEKVSVGQPITLTLTVSGKGNIKSLPDIALPPFTNFRTFDANAATNIEKKDGEVAGSKVYKTVLIPTASGDVTIPPIAFSFFDTSAREYRTIHSKPVLVRVSPGAAGSSVANSWNQSPAGPAGSASRNPSTPGIKLFGEDIRYIKTPATIASQGEPLYRRTWFRWLHILLLSVLTLGALARLYYHFFMSNTALYRFRKGREQAMASLKKTEEFLAKNDIKGAGGHLADVLQDFLAAKLGIENRSLSLREIVERLKSRGLLSHTGEKVRNIWETLDLYQFAPAQVRPDEVRSATQTVEHVIDEVEKGNPMEKLILLLALLAIPAFGEAPQDLFKAGNALYAEGKFLDAAQKYQTAADGGLKHWALEYNLGNAYYRGGLIGKAILHYERAFRLNTGQGDILYNLNLAANKAGEPVMPAGALPSLAWRLFYSFSVNTLTLLCSLLFIFFCAVGGAAMLGRPFLKADLALGMGLLFVALAGWLGARVYVLETPEGVVVGTVAEVRSGPSLSYPTNFTVPEGHHILLLKEQEPIQDWLEIGVPQEGLKGWVQQASVEII